MPLDTRLRWMLGAVCSTMLACAVPASASGPETQTLDAQAGIGYVSSYGAYSAWSRRTDPSRYRLMIRHAGRTSALPVSPRRVPFDVSLGKDAAGHVVAVFSRCRNEHDGPGALPGGLPTYAAFQDCRIRIVRVNGGGEGAVQLRTGARIASRFMPTVAGSRVAYAGLQRRGSKLQQGVFTQLIGHGRLPRKLRGGTSGGAPEDGPLSVSLDGSHVLYAWRTIEAPCTDPADLLGQTTELWRDDTRDRDAHRLIRRAGCPTDPATALQSPIRADGAVAFVEIFGDLQTRIVRYDLSTGTFQVSAAPQPISSIAFQTTGAQVLTISPTATHSARLQRLTHPGCCALPHDPR
jgi:hypothetical protein